MCAVTAAAGGRGATGRFFSLFYDWSVTCTGSSLNLQKNCLRPRHQLPSKLARPRPRHISSVVTAQQTQNATTTTTPSTAPEEPELSSHLRRLMCGMPHSVVVVTSSATSADGGGGRGAAAQYRGMTVSSFTTLTLTPIPIVTFNIRKPSTTLEAIRASGTFHVHILSATVSGARVADAFTKGNGPDVWKSPDFTVLKRAKAGLEPPLLAAGGISRVLRCKVLEEPKGLLDVGDHVLVLGKVLGILVPPGSENKDRALCYADREYKQLGHAISTGKTTCEEKA